MIEAMFRKMMGSMIQYEYPYVCSDPTCVCRKPKHPWANLTDRLFSSMLTGKSIMAISVKIPRKHKYKC